ncbi:hypothetical protein AEB_P2619 [Altererythrobacter sp. B11]|nr:hypothetical protein AEB_P2619 [Altererythrobacter sp. B11]
MFQASGHDKLSNVFSLFAKPVAQARQIVADALRTFDARVGSFILDVGESIERNGVRWSRKSGQGAKLIPT